MPSDEFSLDDLNQPVAQPSLAQKDEEYLNETLPPSCSTDDAETFWWTVVFVIFIVAFLVYAARMVMKGYEIRQQYAKVGYYSNGKSLR